MTSRRRNFLVILAVLGLLAAASAVIASKPTRLGLDLKGGIELVYEGRPTPKVPSVTPQAIDDAIETIRKRTDALGVAEPEIQAAGRNQISIGLPDVQDPDRAIKQVGTTAQLQFYDWEANVFGDGEAPIPSLYEAVVRASKQKPKADAEDIPPGAPNDAELRAAGISPTDQAAVREFYDRRNDTSRSDLYYLFGPGEGAERKLLAGPEANCEELLSGFEEAAPGAGGTGGESPTGREAVKNSECQTELGALGAAGPPAGSRVLKVPRGIVVVQAERPENFPPNREFNQYFVIEDDSELSGSEVENPEQNIDPRDQQPVVTMQFSDRGKKAFEAVTR